MKDSKYNRNLGYLHRKGLPPKIWAALFGAAMVIIGFIVTTGSFSTGIIIAVIGALVMIFSPIIR